MTSETTILWASRNRDPVVARIAITGDFLPSGTVGISEVRNWREMAQGVAGQFEDVATTFANLECCLDARDLGPRCLGGLGTIVSGPADSLDYLAALGSRIVGVANNHSYDFGDRGLERTKAAVARRAMIAIGAGRTTSGAPEVSVWRGPGDVRIGFWAAATATLDPAAPRKAGVEPATARRACEALGAMKERGARFRVALLHAGCLRTNRPDPEQVQLMDSMARAGFDIVAASHSHRISGYKEVESDFRRDPSFCFYGLGSLVSGYAASQEEREGLVVVAGFNQRSEMALLEIRPVALDEAGLGAIPDPPLGREIVKRFRQLSKEIADGSYERLFYHDMSQGLLGLYARDVKAAYRTGGVRAVARKAARVRTRHVRRLVHKVMG